MIITETKIQVTLDMMDHANMTKFDKLGVPDGQGGLIWKDLLEMNDEDFDKIEEHFIRKSSNQKPEPSH